MERTENANRLEENASSENQILDTLNQLSIEFDDAFNTFEKEGKKIKKSRVSVKKVRTYLRLAEFMFPKEFSYDPFNKEIKPFFQKAGQLRDIKLQIKFFQKDSFFEKEKLKEYIIQLESNLLSVEDDLECIEISPIKELIKVQLDKIIEKFSELEPAFVNYKTAHYLASQEEKHENLLNKIVIEDDIHEVRKLLKHIFFMSETFQLSIFNQNLLSQKARLKKIGDWNDMVVRIEQLHNFLVDQVGDVKNMKLYTQYLTKEKRAANALILEILGESILSNYFTI
jgi:hypothetical protein